MFAPSERGLPVSSLAARFAAKEALIKASGDSSGFSWQDMVVTSDANRRPSLRVSGAVALRMAALVFEGL